MKNIKSFCGQPLVYWNIKALQETEAIDEIVVSTDSAQIVEAVLGFGFSKVHIHNRSDQNAQDHSSTESVMLEYIADSQLNDEDLFMLVQATSPLTSTQHFSEAMAHYLNSDFDSLLSVVRTKRFFWKENGEPLNYDYQNRPRRQDFDGLLMENGAFYLNTINNIKSHKNRLSGKITFYEMPEYTNVEIDEEHDWVIAEELMRKYQSV